MEKEPYFIKEFTKDNTPEERQEIARTIKAKRAEHFLEKKALEDEDIELQRSIAERDPKIAEQVADIERLNDSISDISTTGLRKILEYFRLRKIRSDLAIGEKRYEELKQRQDTEVEQLRGNSEKVARGQSLVRRDSERIVSDFYDRQKETWRDSKYSKEDIEKYFSEEHLASLSLEDYELLLRRFPSEMVTHVTRQGIRDHVGHMYHTAGVGEYSDGFIQIIADGRLRSPLGIHLVEEEKKKALADFFHLDDYQNKEEAMRRISAFTTDKQGEPGSYVDRMAIHFATEEVADSYYGAEKGNEIFICYPSAHIASQYFFNGQLKSADGGYWNDQWVWANEEKGMDLNAGIVFIPEEARVDKVTGSRYRLGPDNRPIENSLYKDTLRKFIDSEHFMDFADRVLQIIGKAKGPLELTPENQELQPFFQELRDKFGIDNSHLLSIIFNYQRLFSFRTYKRQRSNDGDSSYDRVGQEISQALREEGVLYYEAEDTESSREFWESFFAKNPPKRPSKVIYYKGTDPTKALNEWRWSRNLHQKAQSGDIGFPERSIKRNTPEAMSGLDRFKILTEEVVVEHFNSKS